MRVDVYPTAGASPAGGTLAQRNAVAIDVLRATSTIVTALSNGADTVVPVLTPEAAFAVVQANPQRRFLLGGERQTVRISGFHLGNSPLEYTAEVVRGLPIVFTTTNGTRAIGRAAEAACLYIGALLNAPAVATALAKSDRDVALCCAGTHEQFSLEDVGCAGAILAHLNARNVAVQTNDLGLVAREVYLRFKGRLGELLRASEHGRGLLALGLAQDLDYCAQEGLLDRVPRFRDGQVTL